MSFRKKTRPVIALSSLSRSRQIKGSESDESRDSKAEEASKIENGNNAITTCDNSEGGDGTKEGKDLKGNLEEVGCKSSTDSEGSKINSNGQLKVIQSKRFKRFRPSISNNSRAKQVAFNEDEEHILPLKEESSSCFGDGVENSSVLDIKCDHPTTSKEEGSVSRLNADSAFTNGYPILVDNLSKLDSNAHSFRTDVDSGQVHDAGCSLPSNSSCSAVLHADENQMGFAVTASSITNNESREEEMEHTNTFSIAKESESGLKPIAEPSTELSDRNPKSFSPSNWTRKRKISPCLSRAGRKSDSKIDTGFRKSDEIHKNDKIGILEQGHLHKEDIAICTLLAKTESSDIHSRISDPGVAKLHGGSSSLSENVPNTKFHDASNSIEYEIKDRLLANPDEEELYVDDTTNDGNSSNSTVTSLDVSIESNEIVGRKSDRSELEIKKSKRVRFKPNIVAKCSRSSSKTSGYNSSFKEERGTSLEGPNEGESPPVLENVNVEHKLTPFTQQADQNGTFVTEWGKIESSLPIENERKGTLLQNSYQNATHLGRHSDTEDGSQSEGEGIQHHKRKFTPYLGPKVRQRRRSVTLFEDDGHMSDKSQKDSNPEVLYFLVFILSSLSLFLSLLHIDSRVYL